MKISERHSQILALISEYHKVEVSYLADFLGVSQVTIRKDLQQLEDQGLVKREHGFATLNSQDDMNTRLAFHYDEKLQIAQLAAASVADGETVMIESGSCCALLAKTIAETKKEVTLITNSAFIADYVRKDPIQVILLGGSYQKEAQVMVGPMTRQCAQAFLVDKLFIGTDGFSETFGFTGKDYLRAQTVQDLARQAKHVHIVTESVKFRQVGVVSLLSTEQVTSVYTDQDIPEEMENLLREKHVLVHKTR